MNEILKKIGELKIVPVVTLERIDDAIPLGEALLSAGLPVAEITFRTDAAEEAIRRLSEKLPDLLLGAGTVLTVAQAQRAVAAGAQFIVAPGFNPRVVGHCVEKGIPITPGINSPTQIEMALEFELEVLKFFPAEASGGIPLLKAMAAPYTKALFIPTGGINANNIVTYLQLPQVVACGGSWMVKKELINSGAFEEIGRLSREVVELVKG